MNKYEETVTQYYDQLFWLCWRWTGNHADAQDALHDGLLKLGGDWYKYRPSSSTPYTFAYGMLTNYLRNWVRKERRKTWLLDQLDLDLPATDVPTPATALDYDLLVANISTVLEAFSVINARIWTRRMAGWAYSDIAAEEGLSESATRRRYSVTNAYLRVSLEDVIEDFK